ncbi:MAG: DUF805 domain-containing protein [Marinisporobacter sp.]|jgi:uncharacterized membrane protein YhaH (DUF805 family)|nr:DUF805 domain-containing protein [Marinisporobacter sp.]
MNVKKHLYISGRINSRKYFVIILLLALPLSMLETLDQHASILDTDFSAFIVYIILWLLAIYFTIKRLHDIERSAWHLLLNFIPIYNIYLTILLLFKKGTDGPNKYGEDPLGVVSK